MNDDQFDAKQTFIREELTGFLVQLTIEAPPVITTYDTGTHYAIPITIFLLITIFIIS